MMQSGKCEQVTHLQSPLIYRINPKWMRFYKPSYMGQFKARSRMLKIV